MTFQAFNFDPRIAAGVEALGYDVPTPIQEQAIPPVLAGARRDGPGPDRHRQDGRLRAAAVAAAADRPARPGARADSGAHPRTGRADPRRPSARWAATPGCAAPPFMAASACSRRSRNCAAASKSSWPARAACSTTWARAPSTLSAPRNAGAGRGGPHVRHGLPARYPPHPAAPAGGAANAALLGHHARRYPPPGRGSAAQSDDGAGRHRRAGGHGGARALPGGDAPQDGAAAGAARSRPTPSRCWSSPAPSTGPSGSTSSCKKRATAVASLQGNLSQDAAPGGPRRLPRRHLPDPGSDRYRRAGHRRQSRISHVINYDIPDTVDAYTHRIGRTGRAARRAMPSPS